MCAVLAQSSALIAMSSCTGSMLDCHRTSPVFRPNCPRCLDHCNNIVVRFIFCGTHRCIGRHLSLQTLHCRLRLQQLPNVACCRFSILPTILLLGSVFSDIFCKITPDLYLASAVWITLGLFVRCVVRIATDSLFSLHVNSLDMLRALLGYTKLASLNQSSDLHELHTVLIKIQYRSYTPVLRNITSISWQSAGISPKNKSIAAVFTAAIALCIAKIPLLVSYVNITENYL